MIISPSRIAGTGNLCMSFQAITLFGTMIKVLAKVRILVEVSLWMAGAFNLVGETAGRKLLAAQVVLQAFTANPLAAASRITTITKIHIRLFLTFHKNLRFQY